MTSRCAIRAHLVPRALLFIEANPPGLPHTLVSHHEPGRPTAPFIPVPWQEHPLVPPLSLFPKAASPVKDPSPMKSLNASYSAISKTLTHIGKLVRQERQLQAQENERKLRTRDLTYVAEALDLRHASPRSRRVVLTGFNEYYRVVNKHSQPEPDSKLDPVAPGLVLSEVVEQPVAWLWQDYLPLGAPPAPRAPSSSWRVRTILATLSNPASWPLEATLPACSCSPPSNRSIATTSPSRIVPSPWPATCASCTKLSPAPMPRSSSSTPWTPVAPTNSVRRFPLSPSSPSAPAAPSCSCAPSLQVRPLSLRNLARSSCWQPWPAACSSCRTPRTTNNSASCSPPNMPSASSPPSSASSLPLLSRASSRSIGWGHTLTPCPPTRRARCLFPARTCRCCVRPSGTPCTTAPRR